ncbi:hypothetical protein AB6A23_04415 [Paenibacillus tarimensis]
MINPPLSCNHTFLSGAFAATVPAVTASECRLDFFVILAFLGIEPKTNQVKAGKNVRLPVNGFLF